MSVIYDYLKSFFALLLLLTVLNHLVPKKSFQKYVHFFSELLLAFGIIYPVLNLFGDSDFFLEKIHYETFAEELKEASIDAEKIEYLKKDVYVQEYEEAIALDVKNLVGEYDCEAKQVTVELSDEFTIEQITVELGEQKDGEIAVGKIIVSNTAEGKTVAEEFTCQEIEEKLMDCYGISKEQLTIGYW